MQRVDTIYQQSVLPLPLEERLELARLIIENSPADESRISAYDFLQTISGERVFKGPEFVDKHLRSERDAWDN